MFAVLPQGHGVKSCFPEAPCTLRTMLLHYYLGGNYVSIRYTLRHRHILYLDTYIFICVHLTWIMNSMESKPYNYGNMPKW